MDNVDGLISEVETADGKLMIYKNLDPDYPGIIIDFKPNGCDFGYQIARIENIPEESDTPISPSGMLNTYVWANPKMEDCSFSSHTPVQKIKENLNGVESLISETEDYLS